jgi:hypothetical protein
MRSNNFYFYFFKLLMLIIRLSLSLLRNGLSVFFVLFLIRV